MIEIDVKEMIKKDAKQMRHEMRKDMAREHERKRVVASKPCPQKEKQHEWMVIVWKKSPTSRVATELMCRHCALTMPVSAVARTGDDSGG